MIKVTTSCSGRFHIYDQARQLEKHNLLQKFINDYPKIITSKWDIPRDKVKSLLLNGLLSRSVRMTSRYLGSRAQSTFIRYVHNNFSGRLSRHLPVDSDVFIGLSSFCLEALKKAKENGAVTIVDHGSFHQREDNMLVLEEASNWGWPVPDLAPDWLIEKEGREFEIADRIFVLSNAAKRSMVNQGVDAEKLFVNPLGVDTRQFRNEKKNDSVFRIIQCGAIMPRKGVHYLIKAFNELKLPKAELWFIGGGLENTPLRSFIDKNSNENIRFMGAFPQAQLGSLYNQGSVFVLASIADGFGMVVTQAMACGLPVIVTENVGAADLVTQGENGYVVPVRDIEALKQVLLELYQNKDQRRAMGEMACESVKNGYTWDDYGDRLADYIGALV